MEWTLPARPPFSLRAVIGSHGWVRLAPFRQDEAGGLVRVERLASGRIVELHVQEAPGGVRVALDCGGAVTPPLVNGATAPLLSAAEQAEISDKVAWMLGLGQDFSAFYALARKEPKLARVEEKAQGRILRCSTVFEDIVKTILTTNTTWSGTIRMVEALVSLYGTPLPADPAHRAFPTPEDLAGAGAETLRSQARLGYRAPYVVALAQSVASGSLNLEVLRTGRTDDGRELPTAQLRDRLMALQGVGPYAAACLLMILGRYDFVPVDSWALKLVSHEWHGGQPVGRAEVEAAFARWGAWQGLAFWFWDWSYPG
jgi:3-methyladenine DNA glycosylase/8-oxoguanine DNA glycosylase